MTDITTGKTPLPISKFQTLMAPISQQEAAQAESTLKTIQNTSDKTPIFPVPSNAPPCNFILPEQGKPMALYPYHTARNELLGYIARFEAVSITNGIKDKTILPICFCELPDGKRAWRSVGIPVPRPLYRLPEILERKEATILICEGEKTAEAAQLLFPSMIATTPMHGVQSSNKTDWSPVRGRTVMISPDADTAGEAFADAVYKLCRKAGATRVLYLSPTIFGRFMFIAGEKIGREGNIPKGYDLADALADGWTEQEVLSLPHELFTTPYFLKTEIADLQRSIPETLFRLGSNGVEQRIKDKENNIEWRWICSFLAVTYQTRDASGAHWGRVLELIDNDGRRKEYIMPMTALAGDGVIYREALLSLGLRLAPHAKNLLHSYITTCNPQKRAICVNRTGWHDLQGGEHCFVLPDRVYGNPIQERIVLQQEQIGTSYTIKGSLQEWQEHIGMSCIGNTRLILAVCAALSGPLLGPLGEENFGVHFTGGSSIGKTTALHVAASVWGVTLASWRTTDNAAESLAHSANDTALFLDELSQVAGTAADAMAYMLGNGSGKARARRDGTARVPTQFRLVFLSTGEIGLAAKMQECGKQTKAGQTVRFIEIAADAGKGNGLFECLHGADHGAQLSVLLKDASKRFQGSAGDSFINSLIDQREEIRDRVIRARQSWVEKNVPLGSDGQVQRVGQKFALIAATGELAIQLGILPWPPESASDACITLLREWVMHRGGTDAHEASEVVRRLRLLLTQHGNSRFEMPWLENSDENSPIYSQKVIDRLGFKRLTPQKEWEYFILPAAFEKEVAVGMALKNVKAYLADRGLIKRDDQGKYTISLRVPGFGQMRLYHVPAGVLGMEDNNADA